MRIKDVFSFGTDLWDPSQRFESSWFLPPWVLFAFRALFCLYIFVVRLYIIGWSCSRDDCEATRDEFSYFTILTYWALGFYFLAASVHTLTYAHSGRPLLDKLPRPLQALHSLFYTTIVVFPWLVTIVYWVVLYDGPWFPREFDAWKQLSQHALNTFFAVFEILVPRTAGPPWIHALWLVVILALYLALAYVTRATKGFYPYSFLDPGPDGPGGQGWVAVYIVGIMVGTLVVFVVVKALIWFRKWVTEKKLGLDGKFATQRTRTRDAEMEMANKEHP